MNTYVCVYNVYVHIYFYLHKAWRINTTPSGVSVPGSELGYQNHFSIKRTCETKGAFEESRSPSATKTREGKKAFEHSVLRKKSPIFTNSS